jgi:hypothetical protein
MRTACSRPSRNLASTSTTRLTAVKTAAVHRAERGSNAIKVLGEMMDWAPWFQVRICLSS